MYIPNVWWWLPRGEIAEDSVTRPQPTSCLHCKYWGAPRHVMGGKRVLRKFIIFSRYHSSKSNFPWSAPLLQLFCLFICLFVYFLLLVQLFANLHGTPPWGGMGRGAREQFKGRSLVYDDIWVQKKKNSRIGSWLLVLWVIPCSTHGTWRRIEMTGCLWGSASFLQVAFSFSSRPSSLVYYLGYFC